MEHLLGGLICNSRAEVKHSYYLFDYYCVQYIVDFFLASLLAIIIKACYSPNDTCAGT